MSRLTVVELEQAVDELESIALEISYIEVSAELAASAGDLAQAHGLRGYDAVHLASAVLANDEELALVTGDRELAAAAQSIGICVALTMS